MSEPSDREVRDDLVAHYQAYARSRGVDPSTRDLESLAVSDLVLTDSVESYTKPRSAAKPSEPAPPSEPGPAEQIAADRGYLYEKLELPARDPLPKKARSLVQQLGGEYYVALTKRVRLMTSVLPGERISKHPLEQPYQYPEFGKACATEVINFGFAKGRYAGLNYADRQRALWRAFADIADRSTGALGPWWVK